MACVTEMDKSKIIVRMEVGFESRTVKQTMWNHIHQRNDGINEVNKLIYCEVYEMGAKCFPELCLPQSRKLK